MINALAYSNFSGADYSVIGRGQAHAVCNTTGENRSTKAQTSAKLLGVRLVCDGVDDTRPNGTAHSHAGLAG